jgi:hypothetical protein
MAKKTPGPRRVALHEMADTECASWGTCVALAREGWIASHPCMLCAASPTAAQRQQCVAAVTGSRAASPVRAGTGDV